MPGDQVVTFLFYVLFPILVYLAINLTTAKSSKSKLPPSPWSLPFIGNLHQICGSARESLRALAQKHGDLMLLHLGRQQTVVVSSADVARDVLKTNDLVSSSRPEMSIPRKLMYGSDISFSPYGDHWRQVRRICVLKLLNTHKVQSIQPLREEEVALMVENIRELCLGNSLLNFSQIFVSFATNIVCRAALGRRYSGEEQVKFMKMMRELTYLLALSNVVDVIPSLAWVNYLNGMNKRVETNFREIDSFLDEVIEEHIQKKSGIDTENEDDIVDLMLGLEKDYTLDIPIVRDTTKAIVLDMFAAGTDTTSIVLEWAMSELIRHPEIMEQVQKEVRDIARGKLVVTEDDMENMPLMKSVLKETLRLHPPAPLYARKTTEDFELQGFYIPAGMTIMINAFAIQRDPKMWEEPEEFKPMRFLNGSCSLVDFKGHDFQLIPFGAGRRGCPGILFAMSQTELALANLLNSFDWLLPEGVAAKDFDMVETSGLTSYRKNELCLKVKPHYQYLGNSISQPIMSLIM